MSEKGGNQQQLRQRNLNLIKKYIFQHSPISRVEIAQGLGLTTPTITGMVTPLLTQGLLREIAAAPNADEVKLAGRPRVMLEYVPDAYYICGVDASRHYTNYVLTDLQGNVIRSCRTEDAIGDYETSFHLLVEGINGFLKECGLATGKLLGVGICMAGLIDGNTGRVYTNFHRGWNDRDLSAELTQRLGVPVVIENNVRARAISADLFDRRAIDRPFAYFFVSFGISCQMILEERALYGHAAAAGEIGHTVVQRGGPVCPTCGNRGCLEALAGERAVLERCRELISADVSTVMAELCGGKPEELTIEQVLKAQDMGDKAAAAVMEDVLDYLGIALANTISLISPTIVVVDGRMLSTPRNQELLLQSVKRNMFVVHVDRTQFMFLPYDPNRGARGAAAVVVRELLLETPCEV